MISNQLLIELREMLEHWGISSDNWFVTGEAAMLLSGYPVEFRQGQMDLLLRRSVWPWPRAEEVVSLFPDAGTQADKEFHAFIQKHAMTPDIHPSPHVGLSMEDDLAHTVIREGTGGVRVLLPSAGVMHRKQIIEYYEQTPGYSLAAFDEKKFIRWKGFVQQIAEHAQKINDQETLAACATTLPVVERAIAFFKSASGEGMSSYPGIVTGVVQQWDETADFAGKIAVLTHMLPSQVARLRHVAGIITDQGGILSHAAIIAREYKIPTVIGTKTATSTLRTGDRITLDATQGIITQES